MATMNDEQIRAMLAEVFQHADYDAYKQMFVEQCIEDPQENERYIKELIAVARKHVKKAAKKSAKEK